MPFSYPPTPPLSATSESVESTTMDGGHNISKKKPPTTVPLPPPQPNGHIPSPYAQHRQQQDKGKAKASLHETSDPKSKTYTAHAQSSIPPFSLRASLSLPKELLTKYSTFIQQNASSVSQIESALRSLTYVIPGRFRDAEIASESLHSSIQLLSLYHDTLLTRALAKLPGMPRLTPHNRYTTYWMQKSGLYRRTAILLQCVRYTELLWEMAAKRRGEKIRWRVVCLLEAMKAVCRLLLLWITGGRMVVPPLPEREGIPEDGDGSSKQDDTQDEEDDDSLIYGPEQPPLTEKQRTLRKSWYMPRTGLKLPSMPSPNPSSISSYLLGKVLTADDIKPATRLLSKIHGSAQLAEILHILRPVIYAVAMARARDKRAWQPWLLGVSVELAARQLRRDNNSLNGTPGLRETALEREEWNRRGWAMGWWALRGAFYENVTKGWVDGLVNSKWMPGIVGGVVLDYAFLWEEYHFASSDM